MWRKNLNLCKWVNKCTNNVWSSYYSTKTKIYGSPIHFLLWKYVWPIWWKMIVFFLFILCVFYQICKLLYLHRIFNDKPKFLCLSKGLTSYKITLHFNCHVCDSLSHTRMCVCARARMCNLTNVLSNETQTKVITFAEERSWT
jgi:hypothetical protein